MKLKNFRKIGKSYFFKWSAMQQASCNYNKVTTKMFNIYSPKAKWTFCEYSPRWNPVEYSSMFTEHEANNYFIIIFRGQEYQELQNNR